MTQTTEQLQTRIAELEAEKVAFSELTDLMHKSLEEDTTRIGDLLDQLAAAQLQIKTLREALTEITQVAAPSPVLVYQSMEIIAKQAIAQPTSTEALDAYVAEKVNEIESCRDWYKRRIDLLQEWQRKMRDPERTIVCDIIANGLTMPEGGRYEIGKSDLSTLTRQRDLAVEALEPFAMAYQPEANNVKRYGGDMQSLMDKNTCTPSMTMGHFRAAFEAISAIKESEGK